ncbi:hypothetical protein TCAL_04746 [Tigriopus californicus]|uniref:B3/B4 tRNA-binding domain-containing protein n=1 Tax=Tigriopus californicus TaxID=6832 RepID=A0A553P407_TIGCA|nr:leucine-rich repeat-containing protein 47-like [Tigriopus californicus]TRY72380.1 hypothetical protein TCAL_04746 [Tigriopus californicus]|eukprot:TCALIF_04746-PA protein Name:"Similar to Lrrc47 Leucine-rich repeat-containing protein 47 (Mus musculus)" AED:0.03 eAED:0.03 QI:0/-1/0/1/-1/1/1/0/532
MSTWPEVERARQENRRELKLSGATLSERLASNGGSLCEPLFQLTHLNLLDLSSCPTLVHVSDQLGQLTNLSSLLLNQNGITSLSGPALSHLTKLKVLDVSGNQLTAIPDQISALTALTTLNLANNAIESMPVLKELKSLAHVDLGGNQLKDLSFICHEDLSLLATLVVAKNRLEALDPNLAKLVSLKKLDASDNPLPSVPGELADLSRMKELLLQNNPLQDNRLKKMVAQKGTKPVLDYIRQNCPRTGTDAAESTGEPGKKGKGKKGKKNAVKEVANELDEACDVLEVLHIRDESPLIVVEDITKDIRPYIIGCLIRGVDLSGPNLKKFIQLQTKLHDTVCEKRLAATIATHDLAKIVPGKILYTAKTPDSLHIQPLNQNRAFSAPALVQHLRDQAEAVRKEKKRNTFSGIHQYLNLLKDKAVYACLVDELGTTLSFPPITNSDVSKIGPETRDILVEVTSTVKLATAKTVCDALLRDMLELGLGQPTPEGQRGLQVEQMRIEDAQGNLKVIYPSKTDLTFEGSHAIQIIRP